MAGIPRLKVSLEEATNLIENQISRNRRLHHGNWLSPQGVNAIEEQCQVWELETYEILENMFDTPELAQAFQRSASTYMNTSGSDYMGKVSSVGGRVEYKRQALEELLKELPRYEHKKPVPTSGQSVEDNVALIDRICNRFHTVVRQLRRRHQDRPTVDVNDEYDVQDLLHALLRMFFDDIREEESSPSYAGGASRIDFLLKSEQILIEVKKTRQTLKERDLGAQLIVDIERYKAHPDCKILYCFVYDPDGYLKNPKGIENDLSRDGEPFPVKVFIGPKSH